MSNYLQWLAIHDSILDQPPAVFPIISVPAHFFVQRRVQTVLPVNFELHRCGHDQIRSDQTERPLNMLLKLVSLCSHDTDDPNQHQTATMFISTCRRPSLLSLNPLNIYPNTNTDV